MGVRVGKEHEQKGAHRGHGHEEVLVEHLAVTDVFGRLEQHVVAGHQKRYQEQHELGPKGARAEPRPEQAGGLEHDGGHEQGKRHKDAP